MDRRTAVFIVRISLAFGLIVAVAERFGGAGPASAWATGLCTALLVAFMFRVIYALGAR